MSGKFLTTGEADTLLVNGPTRLLMETRHSSGALVFSWEVGHARSVLREVFPRSPGERPSHQLIMRGSR